jgi:hypothetical protein
MPIEGGPVPTVTDEAIEVGRAQLPPLQVGVHVDSRDTLFKRPLDGVVAQQPFHLIERGIDPHRVQECRVHLD